METEKKLFKILAEYGRIHEEDIIVLYKTYHYARKRIRQMFAEKYLKTVNAVVEDEGDINVTAKSKKRSYSALINKADEGDIDVVNDKGEQNYSAVRRKGNEGAKEKHIN